MPNTKDEIIVADEVAFAIYRGVEELGELTVKKKDKKEKMKSNQNVEMVRQERGKWGSKKMFCSLLLACIVLMPTSCNESSNLPVNDSFKVGAFNDFSSRKVTQKSPEIINIFVDTSYSNRGFIAPDNSDFLKCIRDLCAILNPDISVNFFAFGSAIELVGSLIQDKEDNPRISDILDKLGNVKLYDDQQTRFDSLFDFIEENKKQNEFNLIFTDAIHSENKNTENVYVELTNYIRKFASQSSENNLFGLLGSMGKYVGTYYTESSCPNIDKFDGLRPFYCFIFGSRTHVSFIKTHLLKHWQKHFLLYPASVKNLTVDKTKTNVGLDDNLLDKGVVVLSKVKETDVFSIPVKLKSDDFASWNLEKFNTTMNMKIVELHRGDGKKKDGIVVKVKKEIPGIEHSISNLSFNGKNELAMTVKYKPVDDEGLCIYRLTITPVVPTWIGEWSTDSDCTIEDAQKTLGLENFTRNLLAVTSDSQFEFINIYFVESRR